MAFLRDKDELEKIVVSSIERTTSLGHRPAQEILEVRGVVEYVCYQLLDSGESLFDSVFSLIKSMSKFSFFETPDGNAFFIASVAVDYLVRFGNLNPLRREDAIETLEEIILQDPKMRGGDRQFAWEGKLKDSLKSILDT